MRLPAAGVVLVLGCACGAATDRAALVTAPSTPAAPGPVAEVPSGAPPSDGAAPVACGKPWKLDVIGGDGRVVVVCSRDVRRQPIDESGPIARALSPGLDPARERVCSCVARMKAPAFVDLVFTAKPEEGRVTVQASGDDDLDPDLGPPFVACVGSVVARFSPTASELCPEADKASFIYPVRLDLAP